MKRTNEEGSDAQQDGKTELEFDPYKVRIGGVKADPYQVCIAYQLDAVIGEAVKKLLRLGMKHKTAEQDAREAIRTINRWLEIKGYEPVVNEGVDAATKQDVPYE